MSYGSYERYETTTNSVTEEPRWRIALYWGVVIAFFTLPLVVLVLHLAAIFTNFDPTGKHIGEFKYVFEFHRTLAALVAALAGLNSWDKRIVKNENGKEKEK